MSCFNNDIQAAHISFLVSFMESESKSLIFLRLIEYTCQVISTDGYTAKQENLIFAPICKISSTQQPSNSGILSALRSKKSSVTYLYLT